MRAEGAAKLLRSLVSMEVAIVVIVIFVAGVLSSLAPPSKALAAIGSGAVRVGPGPVTSVVNRQVYRLEFRVSPNRAAVPNGFSVRITKNGVPVRHADVTTTFTMLDMEMGQQGYRFDEISPGVGSHVRYRAARWTSSRRAAGRSGERMRTVQVPDSVRLRLVLALVALAAGAVAVVVVALLASRVL